ncbi:hypothetical protein PENSPDRAFT_475112 [Peniophora sp. CONT]|nr:hypothetical protein PENSPDRAFT_475112 [Peniophora sp. CONT]
MRCLSNKRIFSTTRSTPISSPLQPYVPRIAVLEAEHRSFLGAFDGLALTALPRRAPRTTIVPFIASYSLNAHGLCTKEYYHLHRCSKDRERSGVRNAPAMSAGEQYE